MAQNNAFQRGIFSRGRGDPHATKALTKQLDPTKKFESFRTEFQSEDDLKVITPTTSTRNKQVAAFFDSMITNSENEQTKAAWELMKVQTMNTKDSIDREVNIEMVKDFQAWLRGAGKKEDMDKTPWGTNKDMLYVPGVVEYLDSFIEVKYAMIQELQKLWMRGPKTLAEAFKFYKYLIKGDIKDIYTADFVYEWDLWEKGFQFNNTYARVDNAFDGKGKLFSDDKTLGDVGINEDPNQVQGLPQIKGENDNDPQAIFARKLRKIEGENPFVGGGDDDDDKDDGGDDDINGHGQKELLDEDGDDDNEFDDIQIDEEDEKDEDDEEEEEKEEEKGEKEKELKKINKKLEGKIQQIEHEKRALEIALAEAEQKMTEMGGGQSIVDIGDDDTIADIATLNKQLAEKNIDILKLEHEVKTLTNNALELTKNSEKLESQFRGKEVSYVDQIENIMNTNNTRAIEIGELKNKITDLNTDIKKIASEKNKINKELSKSKADVTELTELNTKMVKEIKELKMRLSEVQQEIEIGKAASLLNKGMESENKELRRKLEIEKQKSAKLLSKTTLVRKSSQEAVRQFEKLKETQGKTVELLQAQLRESSEKALSDQEKMKKLKSELKAGVAADKAGIDARIDALRKKMESDSLQQQETQHRLIIEKTALENELSRKDREIEHVRQTLIRQNTEQQAQIEAVIKQQSVERQKELENFSNRVKKYTTEQEIRWINAKLTAELQKEIADINNPNTIELLEVYNLDKSGDFSRNDEFRQYIENRVGGDLDEIVNARMEIARLEGRKSNKAFEKAGALTEIIDGLRDFIGTIDQQDTAINTTRLEKTIAVERENINLLQATINRVVADVLEEAMNNKDFDSDLRTAVLTEANSNNPMTANAVRSVLKNTLADQINLMITAEEQARVAAGMHKRNRSKTRAEMWNLVTVRILNAYLPSIMKSSAIAVGSAPKKRNPKERIYKPRKTDL